MIELTGKVGYVKLTDEDDADADGWEWLIGGAFKFTPQWAAFADYRATNLQDDAGDDLDRTEFRVGGRFTFGG